MKRAEALDILDRGAYDEFMGCPEGLELEFKGSPYRLDDEPQAFELAKDVSAMANAVGGLIVIGVRTRKRPDAPIDVADALRPLARGLIDVARVGAVIEARVYPRIAGVEVRFYACLPDERAGLFVIHVPPQPAAMKYFMVSKPLSESGKVPGWLVGVSVRGGDAVNNRGIEELYTAINLGLTLGEKVADVAAMVAEIHDRVGGVTADAGPESYSPASRLNAVITERLHGLDA